jgi:hypothetical protein
VLIRRKGKRRKMNPQTVREGKRILAIVDELLEDLDILACVPPYLSAIPNQDMTHITNSYSGTNGGREAQSQLNEHFDLERKVESAAGDLTADDMLDHHMSTRALVDTLRRVGYASTYKPVYPPNQSVLNFKEPVTLLRGLLKDRFATTVEEDAVKFNILRDTVNRENTATADVQALNREYNNEVESRKVEVQKREIMIRKLKEEIEALRSTSESERKSFEQLSEEHRLNDEERFKSEEIGLHQKVKDAEVELHNTSTKCVVDEKSLRATRSKKEAALQKMLEDYDAEMISASETMKQLEIETVRDREILDGVEKALAQLRREEDDYELELEAGKMRQTHRAVIEGEIHQQARIIQAYFRSYIVRVHESQKGKKKKGGKKK